MSSTTQAGLLAIIVVIVLCLLVGVGVLISQHTIEQINAKTTPKTRSTVPGVQSDNKVVGKDEITRDPQTTPPAIPEPLEQQTNPGPMPLSRAEPQGAVTVVESPNRSQPPDIPPPSNDDDAETPIPGKRMKEIVPG